jgi:hypothetical protein
MSVTHLIKTPNQKNKYIRTTQISLQKESQVPTGQEKGKRGPNWGRKGPKKSINRGGQLILTIVI